MKFCRSLAVAAAVAVTTPVGLFAAAPAFAAGTSVTHQQSQPTYAELVKAAADAKQAYDEAVVAGEEGKKELKATFAALDSDTNPLKAARIAADKAADEAADVKEAAEKAVADAEAKLEAAQSDAEKAEAQQALETAKADLANAVEAKQKADATAQEAVDAWDDARVAAARKYSLIQSALTKAIEAKETTEAALATAEKCVRENGLTSLAVGLPSKVVAGTTVDFTLRVTNGTERTLAVDPLAFIQVDGEQGGEKSRLKVEWSNGSGWQVFSEDGPEHIAHIDTMKPGEHSDIKLRMKLSSLAKPAKGVALFAGDASDAYNPCVLGPMKRYDFAFLPAGSDPGPTDEATPNQPGKDDDDRPDTATPSTDTDTVQGGTPKPTATATAADGNLAETGTSSAMGPLTLASVFTLVIGAGVVFAVRRRKAADNV